MKEYITKAKVIEAIEKAVAPEITTIGDYETIGVFTRESIERIVSNLTAADVAEVRHGRWIPKINHTYMPVEYDENGAPILHRYTSYYCSLCGREEAKEEPYCHCGARMDKEDEHGTD